MKYETFLVEDPFKYVNVELLGHWVYTYPDNEIMKCLFCMLVEWNKGIVAT